MLHLHTLYCSIIVSSPDLIRRVYRFQYNASNTESDLRWGWFGSGTETMFIIVSCHSSEGHMSAITLSGV